MICQICGKHNAAMLVQQIIDGKAKELYICKACARRHNLYADEKKMQGSLQAIFDSMAFEAEKQDSERKNRILVCPECGTPLSQVKEKGTIGCSHCFFYFRNVVLKRLREVNEEVFYTGNLPAQLERFSGTRIPLQQLKEELERAIESEEYELAAYFRDKIKEMEAYS